MDDEKECQTRLCKLHAPAPGKGRKRARYGYYMHRSTDTDEAPAGMCGDCDGELPDREWQREQRVALAQSALQRAQRNRD